MVQGLDTEDMDFPQVCKQAGTVEERVDGKDGMSVADKEGVEKECEHD